MDSKSDFPLTDSVALNRIMDEVRAAKEPQRASGYNRVYSRHHRS